jgi:hypothetical protein
MDWPFIVVAQIAEAIQPTARGSKYEEPLNRALLDAGMGEVNGGGSRLGARLEVESADVELSLKDLDGALQFARMTFVTLGAPAGSWLLFYRQGRPRGLPIVMGAEECDSPAAAEAFDRRLIPTGPLRSIEPHEDDAVIRRTARRLIAEFEGLWVERHRYEPANLARFPSEWVAWYDRVGKELNASGFRAVGDVATVSKDEKATGPVGFSRKFLSDDGLIRADVFQVAAKGRPPVRFIGMTTQLDESTFLSTSNAVLKWNTPDCMLAERLSPDATSQMVVSLHRQRLQRYLHDHAGVTPVILGSLEQLLASEARSRSLTSDFRRRQNLPTIEEIQRLGAKPRFAERVHREMQRIRELEAVT